MPIETDLRFEAAVREKMRRRNISLVRAMYEVFDQWMENAIQQGKVRFACHKGCGQCCYQMVTCTQLEWHEIETYLKTIKVGRKDLICRLLAAQKSWRRYCVEHTNILATHSLEVYRDWFKKPCPFLNQKGSCDIYPVRPIDCRTTHAYTRCTDPGNQNIVRFVFDWELYPNNWILEEQARRGVAATTPLLHCIHLLKIKK